MANVFKGVSSIKVAHTHQEKFGSASSQLLCAFLGVECNLLQLFVLKDYIYVIIVVSNLHIV